ncbi:MAG: DNA-protecting protein DprA [Clostridiales bacterium]|nr:DNA-protecting protein DprA [Clostridiales bacterium]
MTRQEYNYWISNITNIGPKKIELLLDIFGNAEEVFKASRNALGNVIAKAKMDRTVRFMKSDLDNIIQSKDKEKISKNYGRLLERGIQFITKEDKEYPDKLREIYNPPFALFVKGRLPDKARKAIAIVGARECTPYGKETTRYMSKALASEGVIILSGMARGIDSYAHMGALEASGITCAVLGCGIDICYPKENINLYMEIQDEGAIISEYGPGVQPYAGNFPMRNRIISGLSDGVLVIEAKEKSGSLITVDMGLDQGKEIYALPGRISDRLSSGCNNLIKMGAKPVTSPQDILEDLFINYKNTPQNRKENGLHMSLNSKEKQVYDLIGIEPMHMEFISCQTEQPLDELMEILLRLELAGAITQSMKNYYVRKL